MFNGKLLIAFILSSFLPSSEVFANWPNQMECRMDILQRDMEFDKKSSHLQPTPPRVKSYWYQDAARGGGLLLDGKERSIEFKYSGYKNQTGYCIRFTLAGFSHNAEAKILGFDQAGKSWIDASFPFSPQDVDFFDTIEMRAGVDPGRLIVKASLPQTPGTLMVTEVQDVRVVCRPVFNK